MKESLLKLALFKTYTIILLCLFCFVSIYATNNENSENFTTNSSVLLQSITVTGTVSTTEGDPLPGVNVTVKGTSTGTITDLNGKYTIEVPNQQAELVFSFVGYLKETFVVGANEVLDVQLVEDIAEMEAVVVTALGIRREKKSLGYAVSTIDAKDITLTGNTNFASALYGKIAGVKVNASPGGASSAVNIQIRGVNSFNNNTQPLYVVDGIPIRNHALLNYDHAANASSFWNEQRVRENGILDINPDDIESLTVLKGASASALYGSEAANGVIVITTKKGSGAAKKGLGVEVNYQYDFERIAFQPEYQNLYGPGYDRESNLAITGTEEGWITEDDGAIHPYYGAYGQFGPKFDGRNVTYWDGSTKAYSADEDNYKDFFKNGFNSTFNVAFSNGSDIGSYRFSYTRTDYKGIMPGYDLNKNYFNFNGSLKLNDKVSIDLVSSYINSLTHNRPYMLNQIFGSYSGFFSRMDDMDILKEKSQTTKGYKWVNYNQQYDDEERLLYRIRPTNILDYFWRQKKNSYDEYNNRFINSATLNINVTKDLLLRGRIGNDFTNIRTESKEHNEYSTAYGTSGSYSIQNGRYSLLYGDVMLSYNLNLTSDLGLTITAGITGKEDQYNDASAGTNGGLVLENWFNLKNSANDFNTNQIKGVTKRQAYMAQFGMLEFSCRDLLFVQGTGRYEKTSTLPPGDNSFFYPSFNTSFIFSDLLTLPSFFNYGKFRASWGIVGNDPEMYAASVAYNQGIASASGGNAIYIYSDVSGYGNDKIKSEKKYETEFGLELNFLENRLGVDLSYYNNKIQDQIIQLSTPTSSGSTSMLSNIGNLTNQGFEAVINVTPVLTPVFKWNFRFIIGFNKNRLDKLMEDVDYLLPDYGNFDGGSVQIRAAEGEPMGDIYVHPIATNEDGKKIVNSYGVYNIDYENYEKVGNVMPKAVGGFTNTLTFKDISLDFVIDYKLGGYMVSTPMHYMTGAGMFESTLQYRDAEHGGLSYRIEEDGTKIQDANGPYHDGLILEGVNEAGETNTTIVDAASYYLYSFGWGTYSGAFNRYKNAVNKNSYIKMREVSLSYTLPRSASEKAGFNNIRLSLVGKNLFYIWKTLPNNWDPEAAIGYNWLFQGIDQAAAAPTRSIGIALRASF